MFLIGQGFLAPGSFATGGEGEIPAAFPIPEHYKLTNDYGNMLPIAASVEINRKLRALERHNGTQIVFLSVPHVGAEGAHEYARKVFEKWNIGNNGQGNGVLFLVSAESAYIMTGPGIAGAIPDVKVARIFREVINPLWAREMYSAGVDAGIDALIKAAKREDTAATRYDYAHPIGPIEPEHLAIAALAIFGVGYGAVLGWRYRSNRRRVAS